MPSLGETEIIKDDSRTTIGEIRVQYLAVGSAIFPRLKLSLVVNLDDNPGKQPQPAYPGLELRDLRGELRVAEGAGAIGLIEWTGATALLAGRL
jgi:hypothetical protein